MASAVAARLEPSLSEALSDPIVKLVMQKDGVKDDDIWPLIESVRQSLNRARKGSGSH